MIAEKERETKPDATVAPMNRYAVVVWADKPVLRTYEVDAEDEEAAKSAVLEGLGDCISEDDARYGDGQGYEIQSVRSITFLCAVPPPRPPWESTPAQLRLFTETGDL